MKKTIIVLLAAIMALSVVGCTNRNSNSESSGEGSFKNASVGDVIKFGRYEQDNDPSNGKENIEWIVLAKKRNSVLVISKYALDYQRYNMSYTDVTWETCSLRRWLNRTFLNEAFSAEEQNRIQSSAVAADKNPSYGTPPGNKTTDKVFLLSIAEADSYFGSDEARKCAPTAYAIAQSAYADDSDAEDDSALCWWWLRSPGEDSFIAANVDIDGSVYTLGLSVFDDDVAVRPALWLDLTS